MSKSSSDIQSCFKFDLMQKKSESHTFSKCEKHVRHKKEIRLRLAMRWTFENSKQHLMVRNLFILIGCFQASALHKYIGFQVNFRLVLSLYIIWLIYTKSCTCAHYKIFKIPCRESKVPNWQFLIWHFWPKSWIWKKLTHIFENVY